MVLSLDAQKVVRAYLAEPALRPVSGSIAQMVLERLANDPTDRVMPALTILRPADSKLLLFYLIQAVDVASARFALALVTLIVREDGV